MSIQSLKCLCLQKIAETTFNKPEIDFPIQKLPNQLANDVFEQIMRHGNISTLYVKSVLHRFQTFKLEVPRGTNVREIREVIRQQLGESNACDVGLSFAGKSLKDSKTLLDYRIPPGTTGRTIFVLSHANAEDLR
ncbi:MAG: ubiquitin-like protein [Rhabdochlamydiaceae bacterium]